MAIILTGKARLEQVKSRLWRTLDNQLVQLDNGSLLIAPRFLITDNNTNPFGDNDTSDVRASHFHDIGTYYHKLIYVKVSRHQLMRERYLHPHTNRDNELISVLEDLPIEYLEVKDCKYLEVNRIFKSILKASGEKTFKTNIMYWATCHNLGYFFKKVPILNVNKLFKEDYGKC